MLNTLALQQPLYSCSRRSSQHLCMTFNIFGNMFNQKPLSTSTGASTGIRVQSVAITGATGLLGTQLVKSLESKNIKVYRLTTRKPVKDTDIYWNPSENKIETPDTLANVDAVINLAGENVASGDGPLAFTGRWTDNKMEKVMNSRVDGTKLLVDTFKTLQKKPKVFLSASAVGYYGYQDFSQIYDETSPKGSGTKLYLLH